MVRNDVELFVIKIIGFHMSYETCLNIPTLSNLQEPFNPLQSLVFFVIGDAEHPQLGLELICSLGIHHEAGHKWHVDSFSEIIRKLFAKPDLITFTSAKKIDL